MSFSIILLAVGGVVLTAVTFKSLITVSNLLSDLSTDCDRRLKKSSDERLLISNSLYSLEMKTRKITPPASSIANRFVYHAPHGNQIKQYQEIRQRAKISAEFIISVCPPSHELDEAVKNIEQSVFWANAAIARNDSEF